MKKTTFAAALCLTLAAGLARAEFQDFTVNGVLVTKAAQEQLAAQAASGMQMPHGMMKEEFEERVKTMMVESKVMAGYARSNGIDKEQAVKDEIAAATDMILLKHAVNAWLEKNPVTEEQIRAEYEKDKAHWGPTEVRLRHILVKTEQEALDILAQIEKGADFAKIAAQKSADEDSGMLDWQSPAAYAPQISSAVRDLKKGEVAAKPVRTPAGFHVVMVDDTRPAEMYPSYEERKNELQQLLMQAKVESFIDAQVKKAEIR